MTAIDDSLRRLGTDHVDLYQIHRFDKRTPLEETLEALHDVVKAGKARYIGASSMYAWQFTKALYLADLHGWTRFVSMQNHYNLIYREEEREMLPLCADQGVGVIPWSPLARGRLTRDWDETTERSESDGFSRYLYRRRTAEADQAVAGRVAQVAKDRGVPRAQGRPQLGRQPARDHRAHRGCDQAAPSRGRGRRAGPCPDAGGSRRPRGALRAARHDRVQLTGMPEAAASGL
jgi:1-deoxyxylulose-5-phosphate synthase